MGNYEQLKQAISDVIKTNGNQKITGKIMQNALLSIIATVGSNATFAGIAIPSTNPGTPDQNVFWIASANGTYSNFNAIEVNDEVVIFTNKTGSWVKQSTGIALSQSLKDIEKKAAIAIDFNTDLKTTRLQVAKSNRRTGKILSYRNGKTGELTTEMYIGTSMDDAYWQDNLYWASIFPSTKLPFINISFVTNSTYNSPNKARQALPNTYYQREGLIFSYKDDTGIYRSYLYLGQISGVESYIPIDNYCFETLSYVTNVFNTRLQVSQIARKQGFTITYNDGINQVIETYKDTTFDNSNWIKDSNWERILTYKDFNEILELNYNIYDTIAQSSINKVYNELLYENKTIDNSGNVIKGNGVVIEAIEIPKNKKFIYTNSYSLFFYTGTKDNLVFLSKIISITGNGVDIRKKEIPKDATFVKGWNNKERQFYYIGFEENFIPIQFGITEIPNIDYDKNIIINNIIEGYNNVNGSYQSNASYKTTQFIPIDTNVKSIFTNAFNVGTYNELGEWIKYTGTQLNTFREVKIDNTPSYIVLNFQNTTLFPFASVNYFPCKVEEIKESLLNINTIIRLSYEGKKFTSYGDSIVELMSWQKYVWKFLRMADHYNRGIGGSKITDVNPKNKKVDENGYYNASNPDSGTITISDYMCGDERINTIPLDTDILCVYAGANDITASVEIGTLEDGDESNFMYAYGLMIRKLVARLPNAKIFLCTPHNFYNSYDNADYPYKNKIELTILDYCKVIKDVAAIYGLPVIDVNALSRISTLNIKEYLIDQVHPNAKGGRLIANVVINEMLRYAQFYLDEPYTEDVLH
nr:MAG TPA: hypothetical protein [Caudoviricetes sp.]